LTDFTVIGDQIALPSSTTVSSDEPAYTVDGKPDRYGRYKLPDPRVVLPGMTWEQGMKTGSFTRASTFAKSISDTYKLSQWQQRLVMKGMVIAPDIAEEVATLDVNRDKDRMNFLAEQLKIRAGSKDAAAKGTKVHGLTEDVDTAIDPESVEIPEMFEGDIRAYRAVMDDSGYRTVPEYVEKIVLDLNLAIAGKFDRILRMPEPCPRCGRMWRIGDLKTGRDLSYGWIEIAVQLGVYANAALIFDRVTKTFQLMPEVCQCWALVMHLPIGKARCTLYEINITAGYEVGARLCHEVRHWRKFRDLAREIAVADVNHNQRVAVSAPTWFDQIDKATSIGELSRIWDEAVAVGTWSRELADYAIAKGRAIESEVAAG
jgi:hypothetical protein